jgi:hypothetical protein
VSLSFRQMAVNDAMVKRPGTIVNDKRSGEVIIVPSMKVTALFPAELELIQRHGLESTAKIYVCYSEGDYDIRDGDILSVGRKSYPIRAYGLWSEIDSKDTHEIVVEEIKT